MIETVSETETPWDKEGCSRATWYRRKKNAEPPAEEPNEARKSTLPHWGQDLRRDNRNIRREKSRAQERIEQVTRLNREHRTTIGLLREENVELRRGLEEAASLNAKLVARLRQLTAGRYDPTW